MQYNKLLIVDGSNMIHRQLSQQNMWELEFQGKKTGGIFGFLRSMQIVMTRYPEYYPVVVFDYGRSKRRLSIYPNYKHQEDQNKEREEKKRALESGSITIEESRDEFLNELIRQTNIIRDLLKMFGIPVLQVPGWEGDDLIAILSRNCRDSVIVTDDKDMYQLLTPTCQIFRPIRTNSDGTRGEVVTYDNYEHPIYKNVRHLTIIKSICGDGSDNIPHVCAGVAYGTATKIADIMLECNEDRDIYLPKLIELGKRYEKFANHISIYDRNIQLVDLSEDYIPSDPYILNLFSSVYKATVENTVISQLPIMQALSSNGINTFDYSRFIRSVVIAKKYTTMKED